MVGGDNDGDLYVSDDEKYNPTGEPRGTWMPHPKDILEMFDLLSKQTVLELKWKCPGRKLPQNIEVPPPDAPMECIDQIHEVEQPVDEKMHDVPVTNEFDFDDDISVASAIQPMRMPGSSRTPKVQKRVARMDKVLDDIIRQRQENQTGCESRFSKTPSHGSPKGRVAGSPRSRFFGSRSPKTVPSKDRNFDLDTVLSGALSDISDANTSKVSVPSVVVSSGFTGLSSMSALGPGLSIASSMSVPKTNIDNGTLIHESPSKYPKGDTIASMSSVATNSYVPLAHTQHHTVNSMSSIVLDKSNTIHSVRDLDHEPIVSAATGMTPDSGHSISSSITPTNDVMMHISQHTTTSITQNLGFMSVPSEVTLGMKPIDQTASTPLNLSHTPTPVTTISSQSPHISSPLPQFHLKSPQPRPAHVHQQPTLLLSRSPKPAHSLSRSPQPNKRPAFSTESANFANFVTNSFYSKSQLKPPIESTNVRPPHKSPSPTSPNHKAGFHGMYNKPPNVTATMVTLPSSVAVNLQKVTNSGVHPSSLNILSQPPRRSPNAPDARKKLPVFVSELPQVVSNCSVSSQQSPAVFMSDKQPTTTLQPSLKLTVSKNLLQQQSPRISGLVKQQGGKSSQDTVQSSYKISTSANTTQAVSVAGIPPHKPVVVSPHKLSIATQSYQKSASPSTSRKVSGSPRGEVKSENASVETHRVIQTGPLSISIKATSIRDPSCPQPPHSQ